MSPTPIHYSFEESDSSWTIQPDGSDQTKLTSNLPSFDYLDEDGKQQRFSMSGSIYKQSEVLLPQIGPATLYTWENEEKDTLQVSVEIAVLRESPLVLIRSRIKNLGKQGIKQSKIELVRSTLVDLIGSDEKTDYGCYVNGWQSWSISGTYSQNQTQNTSRLKAFQGPKLYDAAMHLPDRKGAFSSDMFGVMLNRTKRIGLLAGFLSQINHFGHIQMTCQPEIELCCIAAGDNADIPAGSEVATDWLALQFVTLDQPDPLADYLDATVSVNSVQIKKDVPSGWCSWYHYFTHITPGIIQENLDRLVTQKKSYPIDLVQIDDGYEKAIGDWLEQTPAFDGKMVDLAEEICENGLTPGLWLAPFIVHPASKLYQTKKNLLIRGRQNGLANAGWNWNRFCAGLDMTQPESREIVQQVISTMVHEWKFPYLKLDFLYAAAIDGKYADTTKTRAQILRQGMLDIRDAAGDETYLLGCGAPLGPMIGLVDGMRIGTDVAPDWEPKYFGIELLFPNEPDIPSAKNAIQNILTRAFMHNRWWQNDPDCLLLRESSHLTLAEVQTLASLISLSGGLMLISDEIAQVSHYRMRIAQSLLPLLKERPWVIDWADHLTPAKVRVDLSNPMGSYHLISYTNWKDKEIHAYLDLASYHLPTDQKWIVRSFWDDRNILVENNRINIDLPPHATSLFRVKPFDPNQPAYLGGNLHISQGLELSNWFAREDGVDLKLKLPRQADGIIDLYLPYPSKAAIAGSDAILEEIKDHIYRLDIQMDRELSVKVNYQK